MFPPVGESCRLLVGTSRENYSASRIAVAVEDCSGHILNLNVRSGMPGKNYGEIEASNSVLVDLRVNLSHTDSLIRSLERYGYHVLEAQENAVEDADERPGALDNLIRYLSI